MKNNHVLLAVVCLSWFCRLVFCQCPAGQFEHIYPSRSPRCTNCAPGMYTPTSGYTVCLVCPAGSYCPNSGTSNPLNCADSIPGTTSVPNFDGERCIDSFYRGGGSYTINDFPYSPTSGGFALPQSIHCSRGPESSTLCGGPYNRGGPDYTKSSYTYNVNDFAAFPLSSKKCYPIINIYGGFQDLTTFQYTDNTFTRSSLRDTTYTYSKMPSAKRISVYLFQYGGKCYDCALDSASAASNGCASYCGSNTGQSFCSNPPNYGGITNKFSFGYITNNSATSYVEMKSWNMSSSTGVTYSYYWGPGYFEGDYKPGALNWFDAPDNAVGIQFKIKQYGCFSLWDIRIYHTYPRGANSLSECSCVNKNKTVISLQCKCNPGFFETNGICYDCPGGSYSSGYGQTGCDSCTSNFYCPVRSTAPIPCPSNSFSLDNSIQCSVNAGYFMASGGSITLCPPNSYCPASSIVPTSCPPNSKSPSGSSFSINCTSNAGYFGPPGSNMSQCSPNSYSPPGSTVNTNCTANAGYFGPNGGSMTLCPPNSYCPASSIVPTYCPSNSSSPNGSSVSINCTSNAGYFGPPGGNMSQCSPNSYSPPGSTVNTNCTANAGYFGVNGGTMTLCLSGSYCTVGSIVPTSCPSNSNSPIGSSVSINCTANAGYFGPAGGNMTLCTLNKYCLVGSTVPTSCPLNSNSPNGSSVIMNCTANAGYFGTAGSNMSQCPLNSYSPTGSVVINNCSANAGYFGPAGSNMSQCPPNSYSPPGSTVNTNCTANAGYFGVNGGNMTLCLYGSFCTVGSIVPTSCPPNSNSTIGSSVITNCTANAGYFGPAGGNMTLCVSNFYCPVGSIIPTSCPPNSNSPIGSSFIINCTANAGYFGSAGGTMTLCVSNFYCPSGSIAPIPCIANSNSVAGSSAPLNCTANAGYYFFRGEMRLGCPNGQYRRTLGRPCVACPYQMKICHWTQSETVFTKNGTLTVNSGSSVFFQLWGAGGSSTSYGTATIGNGGAGGYSVCYITGINNSLTFKIEVGVGGAGGRTVGGAGGGKSMITNVNSTIYAVAGGGGGAGAYYASYNNYLYSGPYQPCKAIGGDLHGGNGGGNNPTTCTLATTEEMNAQWCCGTKTVVCNNYCCISNVDKLLKPPTPNANMSCSTQWTRSTTGSEGGDGCDPGTGQNPIFYAVGCGAGGAGFVSSVLCTGGFYTGSSPHGTITPLKSESIPTNVTAGNGGNTSYLVGQNGLAIAQFDCPTPYVNVFDDVNNGLVCSCATGFYEQPSFVYEASKCVACPNNTNSVLGSNNCTDCKANAGYYAFSCVVNLCPANAYCPQNSLNYTVCPDNTNSLPGSKSCSDCKANAGYYHNGSCVINICPSNSNSPIGSSVSTNCSANTGYYGPNGGNMTLCPDNSYSPVGSTVITNCSANAGYFGPYGGNMTLCTPNNYCLVGSTVPTPCPLNSNSPIGSSVITNCSANAGYIGFNGGNMSRIPDNSSCLVGSFVVTDCTANSGFYGPNGGIMTKCPANSYSLAGSTINTNCSANAGYYGPNGGNMTLCPSNSYSPVGSTVITNCSANAGYYGSNGSNMTLCPVNSYCPAGSIVHTLCPLNSKSSNRSWLVTNCSANAGYYGPNGGNMTRCPVNSYCPAGSIVPISCLQNSKSSNGSSVNTDCTANAGYYGPNGANMTICPNNSYCPSGSIVPIPCIPNSFSVAGSFIITNCTANSGYYFFRGEMRLWCPAGQYRRDSGRLCVACPYNMKICHWTNSETVFTQGGNFNLRSGSSAVFEIWGAGGSATYWNYMTNAMLGNGGAGGYSMCYIKNVNNSSTFNIEVGVGGINRNSGGMGGGKSSLKNLNSTKMYAVAGGGGGGASLYHYYDSYFILAPMCEMQSGDLHGGNGGGENPTKCTIVSQERYFYPSGYESYCCGATTTTCTKGCCTTNLDNKLNPTIPSVDINCSNSWTRSNGGEGGDGCNPGGSTEVIGSVNVGCGSGGAGFASSLLCNGGWYSGNSPHGTRTPPRTDNVPITLSVGIGGNWLNYAGGLPGKNGLVIAQNDCPAPYVNVFDEINYGLVCSCNTSFYEQLSFTPESSICVACPNNTDCPIGSSNCTDCKANSGYYGECTNVKICPMNMYCIKNSMNYTICPNNTNSLPGSKSCEDCVANSGYYGSCTNILECPSNSYSMSGVLSCSGCDSNAGYYHDGSCIINICPWNSYCPKKSFNDTKCPNNTNSVLGSKSCFDCVANAGYYGNCTNVIKCPNNTFSNSGSLSCSDCVANVGYYGNCTNVLKCSSDSYCPYGSLFPLPCPSNTFSVSGSGSCDDCKAKIGYYGNCLDTYPCPANSYCPEKSIIPIFCPDNTKSLDRSSSCYDCIAIAGYYGTCNNTCICPKNTNSLDFTSECRSCVAVAGYYGTCNNTFKCPQNTTSLDFTSQCSSCVAVAGYYGTCNNTFRCPENTTSLDWAQDCSYCVANAGYYGRCTNISICPMNAYCPNFSPNYVNCPVNTYSYEGSTDINDCCARGYYSRGLGRSCSVCPNSTSNCMFTDSELLLTSNRNISGFGSQVIFQMWGAGGSSTTYASALRGNGGTGGYSMCYIRNVSANFTFKIEVGLGGIGGRTAGGAGGGKSGVSDGNITFFAVAGGGGGGGASDGRYQRSDCGDITCVINGNSDLHGGNGGGNSPTKCSTSTSDLRGCKDYWGWTCRYCGRITGAGNLDDYTSAMNTLLMGKPGTVDTSCRTTWVRVSGSEGGDGCGPGSGPSSVTIQDYTNINTISSVNGAVPCGGGGAGFVSNVLCNGGSFTGGSAHGVQNPLYKEISIPNSKNYGMGGNGINLAGNDGLVIAQLPCSHPNTTTVYDALNHAFVCTCNIGFFKTREKWGCTLCPEGTYQNISGSSFCVNCPPNTNTKNTLGNKYCSDCFGNGGYYGNCTNISICPINAYCPNGSQVFIPCPKNTTSPMGSKVCTDCVAVAGYYAYEPCDIAMKCPENTYSLVGATSCFECKANKGYYGVCTSIKICPNNTYCPGDTLAFYRCPNNTRSNMGSSSCFDCVADYGYYGNCTNTTICPINAYCPLGTNTFYFCPNNTGSFTGSWDCSQCYSNSGYYGICNNTFACPANTKSLNRTLNCSGCFAIAGYYGTCNNTIACPANTYSQESSVVCTDCVANAGYYGTCNNTFRCPNNTHSLNGSKFCNQCVANAGYFGNCTDVNVCPTNAYCPNMSYSFISCPPNTYSSNGSKSCSECMANAGYYVSSCVVSICPPNTYSIAGATDVSECCPTGYYSKRLGRPCVICPNNPKSCTYTNSEIYISNDNNLTISSVNEILFQVWGAGGSASTQYTGSYVYRPSTGFLYPGNGGSGGYTMCYMKNVSKSLTFNMKMGTGGNASGRVKVGGAGGGKTLIIINNTIFSAAGGGGGGGGNDDYFKEVNGCNSDPLSCTRQLYNWNYVVMHGGNGGGENPTVCTQYTRQQSNGCGTCQINSGDLKGSIGSVDVTCLGTWTRSSTASEGGDGCNPGTGKDPIISAVGCGGGGAGFVLSSICNGASFTGSSAHGTNIPLQSGSRPNIPNLMYAGNGGTQSNGLSGQNGLIITQLPCLKSNQSNVFDTINHAFVCVCNAGFYLDSLLNCVQCPVNTGSLSGSNNCSDCISNVKGYYGVCTMVSTCPANTMSLVSSKVCSDCVANAGYYGNCTSVFECPANKYCPAFSYQFLDCPNNTYSLKGSKNCTDCLANVGYFAIQPCVIVAFCPSCGHCKVGTYNPFNGSTYCANCTPGFYKSQTFVVENCSMCSEGKYNTGVGLSSCTECSIGYFQSSRGLTYCNVCSIGTYASQTGLSICAGCDIGKYSSVLGSSFCIECVPGSYNSMISSTNCTSCSPGFYLTYSKFGPKNYLNNMWPPRSEGNDATYFSRLGYNPEDAFQYVVRDSSRQMYLSYPSLSCSSSNVTNLACVPFFSCEPCRQSRFGQCATCDPNYCYPPNPIKPYFWMNYGSDGKTMNCYKSAVENSDYFPEPTIFRTECDNRTQMYLTVAPERFTQYEINMTNFRNPYWWVRIYACDFDDDVLNTQRLLTPYNFYLYCDLNKYLDFSGGDPDIGLTYFWAKKLFFLFSNIIGAPVCDAENSLSMFGYSMMWSITYRPSQYLNYIHDQYENYPLRTWYLYGKQANHHGCYYGYWGDTICPLFQVIFATQCYACPPGSYNPYIGASYCINCPVGKYTNLIGSASQSECMDCAVGTYNENEGVGIYGGCLQCRPGFYDNSMNILECQYCSPGTYSSGFGSTFCSLCVNSTYTSEYGQSICLDCPLGQFTGLYNQSVCELCVPGKYRNESNSSECVFCEKGSFASGGAVNCSKCLSGTYASGIGQSVCTFCILGTYGNITGATSSIQACFSCPLGKYNNRYFNTFCYECPASTYASILGLVYCVGCLSGKYSTSLGNVFQSSCIQTANKTNTSVCTACRVCPPEAYTVGICDSNTDYSCACPENYFFNETINQCVKCRECAANGDFRFPSDRCYPGATYDTVICKCKRGFFGNGNRLCYPCPNCSLTKTSYPTPNCDIPSLTNEFSLESFTSCQCIDSKRYAGYGCCPPGYYCKDSDPNIYQCKNGTYSDKSDQTACTQCPSFKYQKNMGSSFCHLCPHGKSSTTNMGIFCINV